MVADTIRLRDDVHIGMAPQSAATGSRGRRFPTRDVEIARGLFGWYPVVEIAAERRREYGGYLLVDPRRGRNTDSWTDVFPDDTPASPHFWRFMDHQIPHYHDSLLDALAALEMITPDPKRGPYDPIPAERRHEVQLTLNPRTAPPPLIEDERQIWRCIVVPFDIDAEAYVGTGTSMSLAVGEALFKMARRRSRAAIRSTGSGRVAG